MNQYVSFAVWVTVLYILYNVAMIAYDLYKEGHKSTDKPNEQTMDVSDMVEADQAKEVTEEDRELKKILDETPCQEEDGVRIYAPAPPATPEAAPAPAPAQKEKENAKEEKLEGQEEIAPDFGFKATPDEFEEYLLSKHSTQSRQNPKENVIDRL
jgi:hypothetical protein